MSVLHLVRGGDEPPFAPKPAGAILAHPRGAHEPPRDGASTGDGGRR